MTGDAQPWTGLEFRYPYHSDALFDKLRKRYPEGQDIRERMGLALIDFLKNELEQMRTSQAASGPAAFEQHEKDTIPYFPIAENPPEADANLCHPKTNLQDGIFTEPHGLDNPSSHIVFSISDQPVMKRHRKKMSSQERINYKRVRETGACDSCKRRKNKCTHTGDAKTISTNPESLDSVERSSPIDDSKTSNAGTTDDDEH